MIALIPIAIVFTIVLCAPKTCGIWFARVKRAYDEERSKGQ